MKKTLLLIASAALLLVGCAKEKLGPEADTGEMVTANFTAQMQGMPQTKSVTDGEGTKANRCVMEIYYKGVLYTRDVQTISNMTATFTPRLVSNRTYDVLFWADCGEGLADKYYTTDAEGLGLQAVEMVFKSYDADDDVRSYDANDDARDAFYTKERVSVGQQVSSETFTLTRPFAQVNIITTDAAIIKNANLYPDGVKMVYTAPTKFNLLSGELSKEEELTVKGTPYEAFVATSPALTLEMDYLFAILDKSALDIAFEASKTGESTVTSHSFSNIPVQRNYRTNIKGALLTTTGNWTATINPIWNQPEKEEKVVEAGSVAAANEAFANGATNVKITSVGEEKTLYLPQTTKEVTIDFANPLEGITVKYGPAPTKAAGDKPAAVNIATNDITKFTVTGISNIVWLVGNQAALANALANAKSNHTVALSNDITMSGQWTPATTNGYTVDGRNHIISNMTITDCGKDYAGLIRFMSGGVVKNITVKDANIVYNSGTAARGGAIVGISYGGTIENCHAENVSIKGYQKMGGIVGYLAQSGNGFIVRNCSAKKIEFTNNTTDLTYQAGGIIGYTLNYNGDILVEGCSVSDITINNQYDGSEGENMAYYCGTFIGSLDNQAEKEGLKIELKNNTISGKNTPQISHIYANTYFGWANNPEATSSGKKAYLATILIDGEEWTPNYPVKNVTKGVGYPTLAAAVTAAAAGDRITLEDGEYTLPNLTDITIEGIGDNVVVNHSSGSICATNNATIKNIVFNLGQSNYHGFQHASNLILDGCTFNGLMNTYGSQTFKNCTFVNDQGYNLWVYGNEYTEFDNCTFTCPGKNDGVSGCGSALNCYNEGAQTPTPVLVVKNCTFTAKEASNKYSAIYIKPETAFDIRITNSSCNDNFFTGAISGSKLWNLKSDREGTTVSIGGKMVYPFSMDANGNYGVSNPFGLRMAIKHWNALKAAGEKSITLANGTYNVSDMAIFQNYADKSLLIKAENEKQAVITPTSGSKQLIFVVAGMSKSYAGHITVDGIKFDFSNASDKTIESDVISISDAVGTNLPADEKALYSGTYHYGHDITIKNCEIIGLGIDNEHSSVVRTENQNGYNVKVQNCLIDKVGYVLTSKISTLAEVSGCTITNSKCVINSTVDGTNYKIIGNTISTYNNYCIRLDYGPVEVEGNNFNITWTKETGEIPTKHKPGVVVLRNSTGNEATITGNTFNKAATDDEMFDVYCKTSWYVNRENIPAENGINFEK